MALFIGTAILLLVIAITGIVLTCKCLRNKQALRTVSIVLLSLITMVLAVYVGLTIFFVYAVSRQPPIS